MNFLSVCSGIEAASVAWESLKWKSVAFSEIDPFPCSVLAHHFPHVPNLGTISDFKKWDFNVGSIDLLVGGTPCQSFSIAGLREGLSDPRGNLALTFCGILDRLRPRWFVWENVPGVLSSNGGRDFGSLLGAMAKLGYFFAWRVLDAQFFGVPQRRRRVFLIGHSGDWRAPATVLFERESLRRNPPESGKAKEKIARNTAQGSRSNSWPKQIAPTLNASFGKKLGLEDQHALGGAGLFVLDKTRTLTERKTVGTLTARGVYSLGAPEVDAGHFIPVFASALTASMGASPLGYNKDENVLLKDMKVRRLTPRECERLQGFPDDWTLVFHRGKPAPDGPRYKAIGNSMAVPVMKWLGERIADVDARLKTALPP